MGTAILPVADTIMQYRRVTGYRSEPVQEPLIAELLNVAVWTPIPKRRESWRFNVYLDEGKKVVADAIVNHGIKKRDLQKLMQVPAYLAVMIGVSDNEREHETDYAAACALIQNLRLAAWERGLAVVWKTEPYSFMPQFQQEIGVLEGERLVGLLQLGYPEGLDNTEERTSVIEKWNVIRTPGLMEEIRQHGKINSVQ